MFFLSLFTLLLLLPYMFSSSSIPAFCLDPNLSLALTSDCSDLRLFKIAPGICHSEFESIRLDESTIVSPHWTHGSGLPLIDIPKDQLQEFPLLQRYIQRICPTTMEEGKRTSGFLGLGNNGTSKNDPYGINNVYFRLMNASGLSGDNNTSTYQDFFQRAPVVHTYEFEEPWNFSMRHLNEQFKVFNDDANFTVFSMKLYSQYCGPMPLSPVATEIELTRENPYTHTLTLVLLKYFYLNFTIPDAKRTFIEYHHLVEVCLKNDMDNKTHHVLVDRIAKGQGILENWNSLLRIIYMGEGDGCSLDSNKWTDVKDGWCDNQTRPCLVAKAKASDLNVKMNKMLRICENFLLKFKIFNGLHNCQHFGTDIYDMMTGESVDFDNWEQMEFHSFYSGREPKLDWIEEVEI